MICVSETLQSPEVTLTGYIWSDSAEMATAAVRPAVLIFPGGGYQFCSDREAEPIALAYMAEGYNAFVLRYSVGGSDFEQPFGDAEDAIRMLHERADEWHIASDKIAVVGFSAGGHLAAMLAATGKIRPAAVVLGYPAILSKLGEALGKYLPGADERVDSTMPPTFVFSTWSDDVVPIENSLMLANALDKAKVPCELHIFERGEHGLSLAKPMTANGSQEMVNPAVAQWFKLSVDWLKSWLGDFPVA